MPTYEYKCLNCGNLFEVFQSIKAAPVEKCPQCAGKVKRLISSGGIPIFKGSGFYQTDYKNNTTSRSSDNSKSSKDAKAAAPKPKEKLG